MRLYYDTIETLAARNKELHLLQDQLKQYEELAQCQDELRQRERGDNSTSDQADYDSASLTSGNTEPELACLPNEEDDNDEPDAEDGDDDENNDDESDDDDIGDDDDDDEGNGDATDEARTDKQTDASNNSFDGSAPDATAAMPMPVHSTSTASKRNDGGTNKSDSNLTLSLAVDSHGKPARSHGHRQASKLPVPNAAARARRHSKHLAISCQNLSEKVHPVLHRRDPNKSLYDVMIAELASVHSNETAAAATKNTREEADDLPETKTCEVESWKSDLALDRTSPPPAMKESLSDEEPDLAKCEKAEGVDELKRVPSDENSGDKAQSSTANDTQVAVQNNEDATADKDEVPAPSTVDILTENDQFKLNQTGESVVSSPAIHRSNPILCSKSLETSSFCSRMETCPLANSIQLPQIKPVPSPRSTLLKQTTESVSLRTLYRPILSAEPVYSKTSPRTISSAGSAASPQITRNFIHNNNTNCQSYTVSIGQSVDKDSLEYVTSHK